MTGKPSIEYHELLFDVRRSVRYHRRRQQFLDRISDWTKVATAVAGSATVASLLASTSGGEAPQLALAQMLAAATAVLAALDVVFGFGKLARRHNDLAREFIALEQETLRAGATSTHDELVQLQAGRLAIEAKEPPHYRVLNAICYDELVTAMGYADEHRSNIYWFQRALAQFVDVFPSWIRKQAAP